MSFQFSDILKVIGADASIIFAAWIFLGFLQARYDSAVERYRGLVEDYRQAHESSERRDAIKREVEVYARRCTLMSQAVTLGLISAVLLILTLLSAALDVIFPHSTVIGLVGSCAAVAGFAVVLAAAAFVIIENLGTAKQLRAEVSDLSDISGHAATKSTKLAG